MRRMHFDRAARTDWTRFAWMILSWAILGLWLVAPLAAQTEEDSASADATVAVEAVTDSVLFASVRVSDEEAELDLELSTGVTLRMALQDGRVRLDGRTIGDYDEGGELDRSWRRLLEAAAMASTDELPPILREWDAPREAGDLGDRLDRRLEEALAGVGGRGPALARLGEPDLDSIEKLEARIRDLESRGERRAEHGDGWEVPHAVEHFFDGLGMMFAILVWFGVLFGIGSAMLFFGDGRLQAVSGTVREEPLRSALIGLAGAFLSIPFYVLVMLALLISILGIPLIIAWAPLFPMLVVLSGVVGWLAVAYGAGDTVVRSKLQDRPWFAEAGVFRRLALGVALLLSPFALAALFRMTVILDWVGGLLAVLGVMANVLLTAIGFGAVLIRVSAGLERHRARRRAEKRSNVETDAVTEEGSNV